MRRIALALALAALGLASPVFAEDKDLGRRLFAEGGTAMDVHDYARAAELYRKSDEAYPAPTAVYWHARALVALGRLVEAYDRLGEAAAWRLEPGAPPVFAEAVDQAIRDRKELEPRIPILEVEPGAATEVQVDGVAVARDRWAALRVDPGKHVITATAPEGGSFRREVDAAEGSRTPIRIELQEASTGGDGTEGGAQQIAGWVLIGTGGAAFVVWAATGAVVLQKKSEVEDHCTAPPPDSDLHDCDSPEAVDTAESAKTLGIVNTVALLGGFAMLAVGVPLVLTAPDGTETAVVLGPGGVAIRGAF